MVKHGGGRVMHLSSNTGKLSEVIDNITNINKPLKAADDLSWRFNFQPEKDVKHKDRDTIRASLGIRCSDLLDLNTLVGSGRTAHPPPSA